MAFYYFLGPVIYWFSDEKTRIQREIDATDKQIDRLVYQLYGLTEEEIKIVEENM